MLFIHHLDVIIDTLITSLILIMFSLTLIAMSGPASTSHNMYLYSIDGGKTLILKEDRGLIKTTPSICVVLRVSVR